LNAKKVQRLLYCYRRRWRAASQNQMTFLSNGRSSPPRNSLHFQRNVISAQVRNRPTFGSGELFRKRSVSGNDIDHRSRTSSSCRRCPPLANPTHTKLTHTKLQRLRNFIRIRITNGPEAFFASAAFAAVELVASATRYVAGVLKGISHLSSSLTTVTFVSLTDCSISMIELCRQWSAFRKHNGR